MVKYKFRKIQFGFEKIKVPVPTKKERFMTIKEALRNPKLKKRLRQTGQIF